jgi:undecaprenyl-phosphate 4-deoxy-4-formamido-L-arabinose transferase
VALQWIANGSTTCEVELLAEQGRPSGYKFRSLLSHFWRLVLSSGTRLLRIGSLVGAASFAVGMIGAVVVIVGKLFVGYATSGWASVIVVLLVFGGLNLLFIGVVAEYIGLLIRTSIGKPLYVIGSDPTKSKFQN